MKYLNKYIPFFEGLDNQNLYKIKDKYFDDEIWYVWSPLERPQRSFYNDITVHQLPFEYDDMSDSYGLMAFGLKDYIHRFLNVNSNKDLCILSPTLYNKELDVLTNNSNKYLVDKKNYVIIEYKKIYTTHEVEKIHGDYKEIIRKLLNKNFTDDELDDIGSWHLSVKYFNIEGVKLIFINFADDWFYILEKDKVNDLIKLTDTYQYYRYVDKENQLVRFNNKEIHFYEVKDIFLDITDYGFKLADVYQFGDETIVIKFSTDTKISIDKDIKDTLENCVGHLESRYNIKLLNLEKYKPFPHGMAEVRDFKRFNNIDELSEILRGEFLSVVFYK